MKKRNLFTVCLALAMMLALCSMAPAQTAPGSTGSFIKCTYTPPDTAG